MNTFLKTIALILTLNVTFYACSDDDDNKETPVNDNLSYDFIGKIVVGDNNPFSLDSVFVNISTLQNSDSLTLNIYKIKFAELMPVYIDMTVNFTNDEFNVTTEQITFESTSIIPIASGGANSKYTITNFSGDVYHDYDSLQFSMTCMGQLATYKGENKNK